jgi:exodeoxyribonuclease VII large subunit
MKTAATALQSRLLSLNPSGPLERGFAMIERAGVPVTRSDQLLAGDNVELHFSDGTREAQITD